MSDSEFLLTVDELAPQARVNSWTLRRYIRNGKVRAKKIGRQYVIRSSEAAELLGFVPEKPEHAEEAETTEEKEAS